MFNRVKLDNLGSVDVQLFSERITQAILNLSSQLFLKVLVFRNNDLWNQLFHAETILFANNFVRAMVLYRAV